MLKYLVMVWLMILPVLALAGENEKWDLAGEIAATKGADEAFEKLQLYKARVLWEHRGGPGHSNEEAISDSLPLFSLKEFRESTLKDGEVFLDSYAGRERSLVFAVTRDQCRLLELPGEAELKVLFSRLHELASQAGSEQQELKKVTSEVTELLLGDLNAELEFSPNVIYSPTGIFNLVPTSLLLPENENITFSRVPSASVLMGIRNPKQVRLPVEKPRILAVGGVVPKGAPELPVIYRELEKLDATYKGITVVRPNGGGKAPEIEKLKGFDLIHVAAHSLGDDRNVWQSSIVLDPTNPDMTIRATELNDLQLDTRLVVLASCSSVTGSELSGEGIQGLTSAFVAAGVPSVVAALWQVDDEATGFFMAGFYEGLSSGQNAAGALAYARSRCRMDPIYNLPYHWGGFILVGESQTEMPLAVKEGFASAGWLFGILGGIAAGLVFVLRGRR